MVNLIAYKRKLPATRFDYVITKEEEFEKLLPLLTPQLSLASALKTPDTKQKTGSRSLSKFESEAPEDAWLIALVDPSIKYSKKLMLDTNFPEYINLSIFLPKNKLDIVVQAKPKQETEVMSNYDTYLAIIGEIPKYIGPKAARLLYNTAGPDLDDLREALDFLVLHTESDEITTSDVRKNYIGERRIYARDVLLAFISSERNRWSLFDKFETELGQEYAYRALYKASKNMLKLKSEYLQNKEVKQKYVSSVDAPSICYVYTIFALSNTPKQLPAIMRQLDNRCAKTVKGELAYADLQ